MVTQEGSAVRDGTEVTLPEEPQSLNDGQRKRSLWFRGKESDLEGVDWGRLSRRQG